MPIYSSSQRQAISQFVDFTGAKESVAGRFLKNHEWDVERAANAYYQGGDATNPVPSNLKKLFDSYRDDPKDEPDKIGIEGAQKYLTDVNVELDEVAHFAVCELLQCPSIGEFNRDEFISGWRNVSSTSNQCDSIERQSQYITKVIRKQLSVDTDYFKKVYRYSFKVAKPEQQRSIPADSAVEFWNLFFRKGKGGIEWNSATTKWLDLWIQYYETKYKRPVNKDLWNMVGELMLRTTAPGGEKLDWWTEDGAWPMAIDEFLSDVQKDMKSSQMDTS